MFSYTGDSMQCSKCGGEMKKGIVKGNGGYSGVQKWGTSVSSWTGAVKDGKGVVTYCCEKCGYLESYVEK